MNYEEPNEFSESLIEHFESMKKEFSFNVRGNYRGDSYSWYKVSVRNCANFMVAKVRAAWLANKLYGTHYNHVFVRLSVVVLILLSSCSQSPYWAVYRNDGLEKKMYLKQGWPRDHKCTAYVNNRPIKRSTWANQFYYRPKKAKL